MDPSFQNLPPDFKAQEPEIDLAISKARFQTEKKCLEDILQGLKDIADQRKQDIQTSGDDALTNDLMKLVSKTFGFFSPNFLSETLGGIKRATESTMPWEYLKSIAPALSDPYLPTEYKNEIIQFIETELPKLTNDINELIKIINNSLKNLEKVNKIEEALRKINPRMEQANKILQDFKFINKQNIHNSNLGKLIEDIQSYYNARKKDIEEKLQLDLVDLDEEKIPYLGDLKENNSKGFRYTMNQYSEFYNKEKELDEKYNIIEKMINTIQIDLENKQKSPQEKMENKRKNCISNSSLNNLSRKWNCMSLTVTENQQPFQSDEIKENTLAVQIKKDQLIIHFLNPIQNDTQSSLRPLKSLKREDIVPLFSEPLLPETKKNFNDKKPLIDMIASHFFYDNLYTIVNALYNKRTIEATITNLAYKSEIKLDNNIDKCALLEIIVRVGELEKRCTFIDISVSWVEARSRIIHSFDTNDGIEKYEKLMTDESTFGELKNTIQTEYTSLVHYKNQNFNEITGFINQNFSKHNPIPLLFLIQKLGEKISANISINEMKNLQTPLPKKIQYIDTVITKIKQTTPNFNSDNFKNNNTISLYICFNFKIIGEMLKFIEEIDFQSGKTSDKNLNTFYKKNTTIFESIKIKRGHLAHSPEYIDPNFIAECLQETNIVFGLLNELNNLYQQLQIPPNSQTVYSRSKCKAYRFH